MELSTRIKFEREKNEETQHRNYFVLKKKEKKKENGTRNSLQVNKISLVFENVNKYSFIHLFLINLAAIKPEL